MGKQYTADELWDMTLGNAPRHGLEKRKWIPPSFRPYVKLRSYGREGLEPYEDGKERHGIEVGIRFGF